uniref:hypothetical protein n=1 Tax=uncultured Allisonella sp. TaxID=339338 RepID=UPI0025975632|nr:hypothetical protein [uncultured Allisonella sp.]
MNVHKVCETLDMEYEEAAIFGHKQGHNHFEVSYRNEGSPDFWMNIARCAIEHCARVMDTSKGKILGDFICNHVAFGDIGLEEAFCVLAAVEKALSEMNLPETRCN